MNSTAHTLRPRRTRRPSYKIRQNAASPRPTWKHRHDLLRRRRSTRVEVVVPTLRQVNTTRAAIRATRDPQAQHASPPIKAEEQDLKMHILLQATIKEEIKPKDIISDSVARNRLALIGFDAFHIDLPRDILEATTTRRITSRIWGGCTRAAFPKIGKVFTHGLDDFMYTNIAYNPFAPRRPGSPGLIFKFWDDGKEWPKIMRLIVGDKVWQYMGQYKLTAAPPLTRDEWRAQPHEGLDNVLGKTKVGKFAFKNQVRRRLKSKNLASGTSGS